jgi:hypothetical protein
MSRRIRLSAGFVEGDEVVAAKWSPDSFTVVLGGGGTLTFEGEDAAILRQHYRPTPATDPTHEAPPQDDGRMTLDDDRGWTPLG